MFVVEGHERLNSEETDLEMLEARDDVGPDNIGVGGFREWILLLELLHNGII